MWKTPPEQVDLIVTQFLNLNFCCSIFWLHVLCHRFFIGLLLPFHDDGYYLVLASKELDILTLDGCWNYPSMCSRADKWNTNIMWKALMNILNVLSTGSQVFKCTNLVYFRAQNKNHLHGPFQTLFYVSIYPQGKLRVNLHSNILHCILALSFFSIRCPRFGAWT